MKKIVIPLCIVVLLAVSAVVYVALSKQPEDTEVFAQSTEDTGNLGEQKVTTETQETPTTQALAETTELVTQPVTEPTTEPTTVEATQFSGDLVKYKGPVVHMFFHPLVVYPELAFDGDRMSQGYDDWFVTVDEFKKVINSVYENDFMLIDITSLSEEQIIDGNKQLVKKDIMMPEGKKPLILSIDDLNYYEYMLQNGNNFKLVLDEQGDIMAYSKTPSGEDVYSKDNEIVTIIDAFVKEHPDFSLNGAKGTIALTGYEGVFGYRTHELDSPSYASEKAEAEKVAARLLETGWNFASHSYYHRATADQSYEKLVADTERWMTEVASIIGNPSVYIYPFGSSLKGDDSKFTYLKKQGFITHCGVGIADYLKFGEDYVFMDRRNIDGYTFRKRPDRVLDLFDSAKVMNTQARGK